MNKEQIIKELESLKNDMILNSAKNPVPVNRFKALLNAIEIIKQTI